MPEGSAFRRVRGWKPATPGLTPSSSREEALIKEASQVLPVGTSQLGMRRAKRRRPRPAVHLEATAPVRVPRSRRSSSATVQSLGKVTPNLYIRSLHLLGVCTCSEVARRSAYRVFSPPIVTVRAVQRGAQRRLYSVFYFCVRI